MINIRRGLTILLLGTLLAAACACGGGEGAAPTPTPTATPTPAFLNYSDGVNGFSIAYPSNWSVSPQISGVEVKVTFWAPSACAEFPTHFEIAEEQLPAAMSLEAYFQMKKEELAAELEGYTPLSEEQITAGGRAAFRHAFNCTYGRPVQIASLGLVDGDIGWYMFCISTTACSGECEDSFDQTAASFRLLD